MRLGVALGGVGGWVGMSAGCEFGQGRLEWEEQVKNEHSFQVAALPICSAQGPKNFPRTKIKLDGNSENRRVKELII